MPATAKGAVNCLSVASAYHSPYLDDVDATLRTIAKAASGRAPARRGVELGAGVDRNPRLEHRGVIPAFRMIDPRQPNHASRWM
jgi:hypothetical protein